MPSWYMALQADAAVLFASVLMILVIFLIARIAKVSQPSSLALALMPMAIALAFDQAILPALF